MSPEKIQEWQNIILAAITAIGVIGAAVTAMVYGVIKGVKEKQKDLEDATAKTAQYTAENYGTLNAVKQQVDTHATQIMDLAKSAPPPGTTPQTVVVNTPSPPSVPPTP